jgi:hypothetical protein
MLIRRPADVPSSEITPEDLYVNRRQFLGRLSGAALAGTAVLGACEAQAEEVLDEEPQARDALTPFEDITRYNNYYEFGTGKEDPARNAPEVLHPRPGRCGSTAWCEARRLPPGRHPRRSPWRSGCTACAASRPGRWSSPGEASRCAT